MSSSIITTAANCSPLIALSLSPLKSQEEEEEEEEKAMPTKEL
jgi:hypothetical protein